MDNNNNEKPFWKGTPSRKSISLIGSFEDEMLTIIETGGKNEMFVPLYIVLYDNAYDNNDVRTEVLTAKEISDKHGIDIKAILGSEGYKFKTSIVEKAPLIDFPTKPCKGPDAPTVQDVIDSFMKVKNKSLPVFGHLENDSNKNTLDVLKLMNIDVSMDDRIDINLIMNQ